MIKKDKDSFYTPFNMIKLHSPDLNVKVIATIILRLNNV